MYKRIARSDGSVVLLVPRTENKSVTWEVMYKVGSRHERPAINGVSHFIEHLFFKGTKRRPNTKALSRELDAVGAEYNAFTSKDHTAYYIQTDSGHTTLGVDMLSDMLRHSKFEKKEMERERGVIVEELNMYRDNPMMRIDELFEGCMFKGTPLGWEIGGPHKVIKTVSHNALTSYRDKHYSMGNAVIGVSGNFNQEEVLRLIDKHFPIQRRKNRTVTKKISLAQSKPRVVLENKEVAQIQLMLGFPGFSYTHRSSNALTLLSVIMGGTMSSRLFINIRERKGLAYVIRSTSESYEDTGYFAVHAGLDKERLTEALDAIKYELTKVARDGITREEYRRAQDNIRGRMILRFEKPSAYLSYLMSQELLMGRIMSLDEKLEQLSKVTIADVNRVARKVIRWNVAHLALIGPYTSTKEFYSLLAKK